MTSPPNGSPAPLKRARAIELPSPSPFRHATAMSLRSVAATSGLDGIELSPPSSRPAGWKWS